MIRRVAPALLALVLAAPGPVRADAPDCTTGVVALEAVGIVGEARCFSPALGGETPFTYYLPPECTETNRCPVLYVLHGFGGNYRSNLTPGSNTSTLVRALREDPVTGADLPDLSFIIVAPHGRTVAPASPDNPPPDVESFYVDWNPRYWKRAPQFERHLIEEFVGLVDRSFPTIATREGRAIDGVSLGGFGSFKLALQHPDTFASAGSISGALNILVAPDVQPIGPGPSGLGGAPAPTTYVHGPRVLTTPPFFPFGDPFGAFGDPTSDEAYYRGNNPLDLALNAGGLPLRFFHNDGIPRDPADFSNAANYIGAQVLEDIVIGMNVEFRAAMEQLGYPYEYEIHPGIHSDRYWTPYVRAELEWQYARVSHPGLELAPSVPSSFNYRSIRNDFSVWGWKVRVEGRPNEEVLTLWDASRDGVTVTGSGRVTIVSPPFGATGIGMEGHRGGSTSLGIDAEGRASATFTLGIPGPTDEHAGSTSVPGTTNSVRICFAYQGQEPPCGG